MESSYHFSRLRVQGSYSGRPTSTLPFTNVNSILGKSLCNLKVYGFQIHFIIFYRNIDITAILLQTIHSFYAKNSQNFFFFLQNQVKSTLFVKTTASPISTTKLVFYPFEKITLYYLEKFRNGYIK